MTSKEMNVILRVRDSHGAFEPRVHMLCFTFLKNHSGSHKENGSFQETSNVWVYVLLCNKQHPKLSA